MTTAPSSPAPSGYPAAHPGPWFDELHGQRIADPYRWLEDPHSPQTRSWLEQQEVLLGRQRHEWATREHFQQELTGLLATGMQSVPVWRGERQFFLRREPHAEHAVLWVRDADGSERILLDPQAEDPTGLTTLDSWQPSRNGQLLAYQLSHGGTEESLLSVLDVATGHVRESGIDRVRYSPVTWLPDDRGFCYVRRIDPALVPEAEQQYHRRIMVHLLDTDAETDTRVFGQEENWPITSYFGVSISHCGRWLQVSSSEGTEPRNQLWLADLASETGQAWLANPHGQHRPDFRPVQVGVDAQTSLQVGPDGRAYIFTDRDAPRGALFLADPTGPLTPDHWQPLIPEDDTAVLSGYRLITGVEPMLLAVVHTRHTVAELNLYQADTGTRAAQVQLPGVGTVGALSANPDGGTALWFSYTDFTTPRTAYWVDLAEYRGEPALPPAVWAQPPGIVQGLVTLPKLSSELVQYTSDDGTTVRMFVLRSQNKPAPTILYGYGGFGISLAAEYSASIAAWVAAGGNYAIAQLRGGGEEGEQWHRAGMMGQKQRVFDDFHAAAQWLISNQITTPSQLGISGGSNGGLLVGAALTQRPELYRAVVCSAPLLDMVRYEQFGLGQTWNVEYGSAQDPDALAWLLKYSPYHQVQRDTQYPAVLFTVFAGDTRVDPMHARKMCAALQDNRVWDPSRPILLRSEADVGHGARSVSRSIALSADTLGFCAHHLGLSW